MTHTISRYLTVVTSTALLVILGAASGRATLAIESESRAQGLPGNGRSKTLLPDDGVLFAGGRNAEGVVTAEAAGRPCQRSRPTVRVTQATDRTHSDSHG